MGGHDSYQANPTQLNTSDYQYSNAGGSAQQAESAYDQDATNAQNVAAPALNYSAANQSLGSASSSLGQSQSAYNTGAASLLGQLGQEASSSTLSPTSLASLQMQQNLQQSNAQAESTANSAQGGGGSSALAARSAIQQAGLNNQSAALSSAQLGQQQQLAAQTAYGTELGQYGTTNQAYASQYGNIASQQAAQQTSQASVQQQQQQLNNQNSQYYNTLSNSVAQNQLSANEQYESQLAGDQNSANSLNAATAQANAQMQAGMIDAGIGAAGSLGGAAMSASDARLKQAIQSEAGMADPNMDSINALLAQLGSQPSAVNPANSQGLSPQASAALAQASMAQNAAPAQMMSALDPYSFNYKPGAGPSGRQYGVMAQDLEKSPMGQSMVATTPSGAKMIDQTAAQGASLAALANLHDRVSGLEAAQGGGGRSAAADQMAANVLASMPGDTSVARNVGGISPTAGGGQSSAANKMASNLLASIAAMGQHGSGAGSGGSGVSQAANKMAQGVVSAIKGAPVVNPATKGANDASLMANLARMQQNTPIAGQGGLAKALGSSAAKDQADAAKDMAKAAKDEDEEKAIASR